MKIIDYILSLFRKNKNLINDEPLFLINNGRELIITDKPLNIKNGGQNGNEKRI